MYFDLILVSNQVVFPICLCLITSHLIDLRLSFGLFMRYSSFAISLETQFVCIAYKSIIAFGLLMTIFPIDWLQMVSNCTDKNPRARKI